MSAIRRSWFARLATYVLSWRRLVFRVLAVIGLAQAATIGVLAVVSELRKRRQPPVGFPHVHFDQVEVDGNTLQLYCSGTQLFADMLESIDCAQEFILLETYIWKGDEIGRAFKEHLIAKAEAGVQVYLIFDAFANLVVPREFKRFPDSIQVLRYGPFKHPWRLLEQLRIPLDHRKLLVVDGEVAFLGGYNIGDLYRTQWRDTHMRVRGPEAGCLGQDLIEFWNRMAPAGRHINWVLRRGLQPTVVHRRNDATRHLYPIRDMYVDAIARAERRVWITTAYFIPDAALRTALLDAAVRGVDIQVVVPWTSNHVVADWMARGFFTPLLAHGIRIFGYRDAMIHAKTMTVDGIWSTVGTANLDRLSQFGNYEINLEVFSDAFADQMERLFAIDKINAFELTGDWWSARPWYAKSGERILAPLRYWF